MLGGPALIYMIAHPLMAKPLAGPFLLFCKLLLSQVVPVLLEARRQAAPMPCTLSGQAHRLL
eukprot:3126841-Amphidinium_carterae.1